MYANVINSAAHWELYFGRKWKSLSLELSAWIESKYVNFCKKAQFENLIDVRTSQDFGCVCVCIYETNF